MIHWSLAAWIWPLLLVLAVGAVVFTVLVYRRTSPFPGDRTRRILVWLRGAALVCLILAVGAPFLTVTRTRVEPTELVVLVEDSGSMAITDAGPGPEGRELSRWGRALEICRFLEGFADDNQPPVKPVFLRGNGLSAPRVMSLRGPSPADPAELGTDLDALVRRALALRQGRPLGAVVLLSDGCRFAAQSAADRDGGLRRRFPLAAGRFFAVGVGDPTGPADRQVTDVRYAKVVHQGDEVQIDCVVEQRFHDPAPGDSLTLTLSGRDGVLARVTRPDAGDAIPASLVFRPAHQGYQVYTLEVSALDNERFPANNEVSLGISVRKERAHLLLLALDPRWEGRFLAQAALKESRLVMDVVYPGPRGLVLADSLTPWRMPRTADGWAEYDGVILEYSSWPDSLGTGSMEALARAVDQGMGLFVLPGPGHGGSGRAPALSVPAPWRRIMPVAVEAGTWRSGEFFLTPLAAGRGHPVLAGVLGTGGSSVGADGGGSGSLPPQYAVLPASVEPGAVELLECRSRQGESWPALVLRRAGRGRVAWFGGDALWQTAFWERGVRPGSGSADRSGRRLLRNLLVWLGTGEETSGLRLRGEPPLVRVGEPFALSGIWLDMRGRPVESGQVVLVLEPRSRPGGAEVDTTAVRTFAAEAPDPDTGYFRIQVPPLPAGHYRMRMLGKGQEAAESRPFSLVVDAKSPEDLQVRQDRRFLVQLAAREQGRYIAADDSAQVSSLLQALGDLDWQGRRQQLRSRYDLAAGVPFLAAVVLLLAVEWYLRRRHGLL